jgi:hypothetical protein
MTGLRRLCIGEHRAGRHEALPMIDMSKRHHTASLWRERATQPNHHTWWATNVAPVLEGAGWVRADLLGGGAVAAAVPAVCSDAATEGGDELYPMKRLSV